MKKLLMGIFGLTLLLPLGVFAEGADIGSVEEGSNSTSQTVTIGTVETPVYEVYMVWENPTFDWVYDEGTGAYAWKPAARCEIYDGIEMDGKVLSQDEAYAIGLLYDDNTCSTQYTEEYQADKEYYYIYQPKEYVFGIEDSSTNGRIIPSVTWTSDDEYGYVEGKFTYTEVTRTCQPLLSAMSFETGLELGYTIYTNESCTNELEDRTVEYEENKYYGMLLNFEEKELTGEELPDSARMSGAGDEWGFAGPATQYNLGLTLSNKEKPTTTPKAGDTLGTVTISIRAAE